MDRNTMYPTTSLATLAALACTLLCAARTDAGPDGGDSDGCVPHWDGAIGQPGMDNTVYAAIVFQGNLVVSGNFTSSGDKEMNRIARWDGVEWHSLASGGQIGVDGWIFDMTIYNGDLVVCGNFTTAGGQTVNEIARWDGSQWHPFVAKEGYIGLGGSVRALTVYDGDLVAGGYFTTAAGKTVNRIARWDGTTWQPFESGGETGVGGGGAIIYVVSLAVYNGDLVAGGWFTTAGGQTVNNIARWDGEEWHQFMWGGQVGVSWIVDVLTVYNGDLVAGGWFSHAGGWLPVNGIARWDGGAWHQFASGGQIGVGGDNARVLGLRVYDGDLIASGQFTTAGGQTMNHVARWDGSEWHQMASGGQVGVNDWARGMTTYNGNLILGGWFTTAGDETANGVATWGGCPPCPWDFNGDGVVDGADLGQLLANWGPCSDCDDCPWDLTGDCVVNGADLGQLLANWGECNDN